MEHLVPETRSSGHKIKDDANPICSRPYPVPKIHKEMLKKEVERLVLLGVLKLVNNLEWGGPSFDQPKPKSK